MFTETSNKIDEMRALLAKIGKNLDLPKLRKEVSAREAEAGEPSFWTVSPTPLPAFVFRWPR